MWPVSGEGLDKTEDDNHLFPRLPRSNSPQWPGLATATVLSNSETGTLGVLPDQHCIDLGNLVFNEAWVRPVNAVGSGPKKNKPAKEGAKPPKEPCKTRKGGGSRTSGHCVASRDYHTAPHTPMYMVNSLAYSDQSEQDHACEAVRHSER